MPDIITLPSGETVETYPDGRIITRGLDGKIAKTILPPETARMMGASNLKKAARFEDDLTTLLAEAGYNLDDCPAAIKRSAEIFLGGQSGAVAAGRLFLQLTRQPESPESAGLKPGSNCPGCGRLILPDYIQEHVDNYAARLVAGAAGVVREERARESEPSTENP